MAFKYDNPNYTEILNILHVTEIYDFHYHYSYTFSPTFKNSKYTGNLEFIYGSKNTLPRNIEGNVFDKNDTGVAICPKYFYPSHIQKETLPPLSKFIGPFIFRVPFKMFHQILVKSVGATNSVFHE